MLPFLVSVLLMGLARSKHPCSFDGASATSNQHSFGARVTFDVAASRCISHAKAKWLEYLRKADSFDYSHRIEDINFIIASRYNLYWQALTACNNAWSPEHDVIRWVAEQLKQFERQLADHDRQEDRTL
jgi:hypothetical protein